MGMKPFVRIIKRGQKISAPEAAASAAVHRATPESSVRDIKTTVSTWVREFQQRSHIDSKRAFNNLFKEPLARTSGT
jgi:hypothetical protein